MGSKPKYWEYRSSHPHHVLAKQELDTALLVLTVDQAQCILDPSSGPMLFSDSRELSRILRELEGSHAPLASAHAKPNRRCRKDVDRCVRFGSGRRVLVHPYSQSILTSCS